MNFYAEIQGATNLAALRTVIGRDDIEITEAGDKVLVCGEVSCYTLGWILDRCSWFGRVVVVIPENKLPQWPSSDK